MTRVVVFDIDGTLSNVSHRIGFIQSKPKNWAAFEAGIPHDSVNIPVAEMFKSIVVNQSLRPIIILATGRNERSRKDTETWLKKNNLFFHKELLMRANDDYRPDTETKSDMVTYIRETYGEPLFWVDDRQKVVQKLRDLGIFVIDVYQGRE